MVEAGCLELRNFVWVRVLYELGSMWMLWPEPYLRNYRDAIALLSYLAAYRLYWPIELIITSEEWKHMYSANIRGPSPIPSPKIAKVAQGT